MTELQNPKHENFAQLIASGETQENAYISAGYSENGARQNAHRLTTNDYISQRIQELQSQAQIETETNLVSLIKELDVAIRGAKHMGQYGSMARAVIYKAKLLGLF